MSLVEDFLAKSNFLLFPQVALILFFAIFIAVLVLAHRMRRAGTMLDQLSRLPLEEETHRTEGSRRIDDER